MKLLNNLPARKRKKMTGFCIWLSSYFVVSLCGPACCQQTESSRAAEKAESDSAKNSGADKKADAVDSKEQEAQETKSADTGTDGKDRGPVRDKWALVVGISKFQDSSLNLKYAAKDARDFYNYLVKDANFSADHVKLLTDEQATREAILDLFGDKWLPRAALPGDLVLIFISSHGSPSSLDVADINYIVAHNTDKEHLFSTGVSLQELAQLIKKRIHSDRVIAILDTCYSGAAGSQDSKNILRTTNINADEIAQGTGQMVICSSEPNQRSFESKNYENSVFTHRLIEALHLKGKDTNIEEAFNYMKEKVQEEVVQDRAALQTPVMKGNWQGENVVLAVVPASPRKPPYLKELPKKSAVQLAARVRTPEPDQAPAPAKKVEPAVPRLRWESWVARVQSGRKLIENDDEKAGERTLAQANADRFQMGLDDPRVYIAEKQDELKKAGTKPGYSTTFSAYLIEGRKALAAEKFAQAETAFKSALLESGACQARESAKGSALDGMGLSILYQGRFSEADNCFKRVQEIAEALKDTSPAEAGLYLEHAAFLLYLQGKNTESISMAKEALASYEKVLGPNHTQIARCLNLLGINLLAKKNLKEAELLIKRSMDINNAAAWFKYPELWQSFYSFGLLKNQEEKWKEAQGFLKQALSARDKQEGKSDLRSASILLAMAENGAGNGKTLDEEASLRKALAIAEKKLPADDRFRLLIAAKLIQVYEKTGKNVKADELKNTYANLEKAKQAVEIQRLYSFPQMQMLPPEKIGDSLNVHISEDFGDLYGKWTWDPAKRLFRAAWDNGELATVKLSRYDKEHPVLRYSQKEPERSGRLHVKEMNEFGMSGWSGFYDLIGKDGKWEAFW